MRDRLKTENYMPAHRHFFVEKKRCQSYHLHCHEFYEIEVILSGTGEHCLNNVEMPLKRGSIYLVTPADFHEIITDNKFSMCNIKFDENILRSCRNTEDITLKAFQRTFSPVDLKKFELLTECMLVETNVSYIYPLIEYMFDIVLDEAQIKRELTNVDKARGYINTHFREAPSLADVASQINLSPVYFGELFKNEAGKTYIEYLNECRIKCAKTLLQSGMTVSEACFSSGFGSLSGFLYTFKKLVGCSPNEYKSGYKMWQNK